MNKVAVVLLRYGDNVSVDSAWADVAAAIEYAKAENKRIAVANKGIAMGYGNPEWYDVDESVPVIAGKDRWEQP